MHTYVITGGTGKTGRELSLGLLKKGNKVRVICRNPDRAEELKREGAEICAGNIGDELFMKMAFQGADAAYVVLPMDVFAIDYTVAQVRHAYAIRKAVVEAGIKFVVTLSSVGAHLDEGNGVVMGLHEMEELFNQVTDLNVKHIRAAYFMENTLKQIPIIKQKGIMEGPEKGNVKFAMVAAKDIAALALRYLHKLDFFGKSIAYALGQRDVSYDEIATIYGSLIGLPDLKYVQLSQEEFLLSMSQIGMGRSAIDKFYEYTQLINNGKVSGFYQRTPGRKTPTSIESFALVFKERYEREA